MFLLLLGPSFRTIDCTSAGLEGEAIDKLYVSPFLLSSSEVSLGRVFKHAITDNELKKKAYIRIFGLGSVPFPHFLTILYLHRPPCSADCQISFGKVQSFPLFR